MADSIEAAITSSISGLGGSDASTSAGDTGAAVSDTPNTDTTTTETADTTVTTDAAAATPQTATTENQPPASVPAQDTVAAAAATPADETLETLTSELAGKRDNRIPYPRVKKIVENAEKKVEQRVRAEVETQYAEFRTPEFQNGVTAMRVADERPEQFLAALAQADPRYAALLAGSKVPGASQPAAGRQPAAPAEASIDIEPDIQLSDGTLGFSAEASRKREAALRAELKAENRREMEELLGERMKGLEPIEREHRIGQLRKEAAERVQGRITAAEKWPHFTELREKIAAKIVDATKRGQTLELHEAYIQASAERYQTDEATVRARVIADMQKAPAAATRVAPGAPSKPAGDVASDVDPIEAAIRSSIKAA